MKIRKGKTRIVILVGTKAIKIAKPRFVRLFIRLLLFPFVTKESRDGYYATYGKLSLDSCKKYSLLGYYANVNEYTYSQQYIDPDIMPIIKLYLCGWIITQTRGEEITDTHFTSPLKKFKTVLSPETTEPHQYCILNKKIFIIDYGDISTIQDLVTTRPARIKTAFSLNH
ncbi:MAG: hypothetical protein WC059_02290 [Candidatus Paceibacterota bacterium]